MSKRVISILLSEVFVMFIAVPTIVIIVDNTVDVSIVFSASEEEEKGNEKHLDVELLFSNLKDNEVNSTLTSSENNLEYYYKKYPKPHLNLIFPPPEQNIL